MMCVCRYPDFPTPQFWVGSGPGRIGKDCERTGVMTDNKAFVS